MFNSKIHFVLFMLYVIIIAAIVTFIQFHFKLHQYSLLFDLMCCIIGFVISFWDEFFLDRPINFLKKVFEKC